MLSNRGGSIMSESKYDFDFDEEEELMKAEYEIKEKTNRTFVVIACLMIILFLTGLAAILYLAVRPSPTVNQPPVVQVQGDQRSSQAVIFPKGTTDWRVVTHTYNNPDYYCEIDKQWYHCDPIFP